PWAVLDRSETTLSRRLVADVQATGYFLRPRVVRSYAEGRRLLATDGALALLVIPRDLRRDAERGRPTVQLLVDGTDPLTASRVAGYVGQIGAAVDVRARPRPARERGRPARLPGPVDVRQEFRFNPTLDDHVFFLAALAGMLLTNLCLSATSMSLVGERERGTYEQILSLPTTALEIVLGKVAPNVVVAYGLLAFSVLGSGLFFGVWPAGSWLALLVVTAPFVLASLAIGVFVSVLAHSSAQAIFITVFFILPSFVLSGVMYPYQFMPHGVREVGGALPLRWYQIALRRIIERGAGFVEVAVPFLVLSVLFAVLLAAIRWRMRPRLG
ncbi:MAG TPA: ABC transporter permease, partial [Candidatus Binatia bacterium]|nr:ABC transporter permease [Candidatus Binatia bacterium]